MDICETIVLKEEYLEDDISEEEYRPCPIFNTEKKDIHCMVELWQPTWKDEISIIPVRKECSAHDKGVSSTSIQNRHSFSDYKDLRNKNIKFNNCKNSRTVSPHINSTDLHKKYKPFKCDECDYSSQRKYDLTRHLHSVHKKADVFKNDLFFHRPVKKSHKKLLQCSECNFKCSLKCSLLAHIKIIHRKKRSYKCKECDFASENKYGISHHMKLMHKKLKSLNVGKSSKINQLVNDQNAYRPISSTDLGRNSRCDGPTYTVVNQCERDINGSRSSKNGTSDSEPITIQSSGKSHSAESSFSLPSLRQRSKVNYQDYSEEEYDDDNDKNGSGQTFCYDTTIGVFDAEDSDYFSHEKLSLRTSSSTSINMEEQTQDMTSSTGDVRDFSVSGNSEELPNENDVNNSAIQLLECGSGGNVKLLSCEKCNFTTTHNEDLFQHVNEIQKKCQYFKCTKCDSKTSCNIISMDHIKPMHQNLKPYKCRKCDFASSWKVKLTEHVRCLHQNFKPYKCSECNFASSWKVRLTEHILTVHQNLKSFEGS